MIFLSHFIRSKESKQFTLLMCFVFLISFAIAQTGVINNGAKIIVNSGALLKITGSGADYTNSTSGSTHGRIDLDGKIELEGDWTNNATSGNNVFINTDLDGEVIFNGTISQSITGLTASYFENLKLDNTAGLSLAVNSLVSNNLVLLTGNVTLNNYNLNIGNNGSITGGTFSLSKMIITNGAGSLIKSFSNNGSFIFPIGENSGVIEYSPVEFTLNSNAGLSSAWIGANVKNEKHPENNSAVDFLSRYWTLSSAGITNPNYDADFTYLTSDINGTESSIYAAEFDGSVRTLYSILDVAGNMLSVTGLSSFADYTGVDGTSPTLTINSSEISPTNTSPIPITIIFNEEITGFELTDIMVGNGTAGNLNTMDNIIFTSTITPVDVGTVTVDINADAVFDLAGNSNIVADQFSIYYDPGVGIEDHMPYEILIYSIENRVIIEFTNEGNYQFKEGVIEVYNLIGQKIVNEKIIDFVRFETEVEHVSQIFIVKLVIDGVPYTKRLYIEKK